MISDREHTLPFVTAAEIRKVVSSLDAIDALEEALRSVDVSAHTPLRTRTDLPHGHLLSMAAQVGEVAGVKLASVAPGNARYGLPRINGLVVLSDARTLRPAAILDAAGLTVLRTSALSALAVRHLAGCSASRLMVFGSGPQAWGHVQAIRAVRTLDEVVVVGRSERPTRALVERIAASGLAARQGTAEMVGQADIVACCTSATQPLFDSAQLHPEAAVVAMGSHSPEAREVDTDLVRRGFVVVESRSSAFAEAGDIILACQDGVPASTAVDADLTELIRSPDDIRAGRRLFKGVGEAWADVVVASVVAERLGHRIGAVGREVISSEEDHLRSDQEQP